MVSERENRGQRAPDSSSEAGDEGFGRFTGASRLMKWLGLGWIFGVLERMWLSRIILRGQEEHLGDLEVIWGSWLGLGVARIWGSRPKS